MHDNIDTKLSEIFSHKPNSFNDEIDIENNNYAIINPIVVNQKNWLNYHLELVKMQDNFEPAYLFQFIKNDLSKNNNIKVSIGIVGRSGVGKSSFINAFFNLEPTDPNYVKTDFIECTTSPRVYEYENKKFENALIWDTPGVGTASFKLSEHERLINHINCDAYIYLYETQFNHVDKQVIIIGILN